MNAAEVPGFPAIGRTVPAAVVSAVGIAAGAAASLVVVGVSGWLIVSFLVLFAAAALPRGPFVALLVVQVACAQVLIGLPGYSGRFALVLAATHLLVSTGTLAAWLPRRARVQVRVLRLPLLRFVGIQVAAQVVAFAVLSFAHPATGGAVVWLGVVGAVAALVLALTVLVPALLRPAA